MAVPSLLRLARPAVLGRFQILTGSTGRSVFKVMLAAGGIGDLKSLAMLPTIGFGIDRRNSDILPSLFFLLAVNSETLITCFDHCGVCLTIGCKTHHQLRNAQRQVLVEVGMPGVPGLSVCVDQLLHELMLRQLRYVRGNQLA